MLDLALGLAEAGACDGAAPFALAEHVAECVVCSDAERVIEWLRAKRARLAAPALWRKGKLILLRACNELLRRLSPVADAGTRGRVMALLADAFPLDEKSALNLAGACARPAREGSPGDGLVDPSDADPASHASFWSLQRYFRDPIAALRPSDAWPAFRAALEAALARFEAVACDAALSEASRRRGRSSGSGSDPAAAEYLTAEALLPLQIGDATFRRHFLTQCAVFLGTCDAHEERGEEELRARRRREAREKAVSEKKEEEEEEEEKEEDAKEEPEPSLAALASLPSFDRAQARSLWLRVAKQLAATPPDGPRYLAAVVRAVRRDQSWARWKRDEQCADFTRPDAPWRATTRTLSRANESPLPSTKPAAATAPSRRVPPAPALGKKKKRPAAFEPGVGNPEIARLWSLTATNAASLAEGRAKADVRASDFLRRVIDDADPEAQIEEEYKAKNDRTYAWKAMRLIARSDVGAFQRLGTGEDLEAIAPEIVDPSLKRKKREAAAAAAAAAAVAAPREEAAAAEGGDERAKQAPEEEATGAEAMEAEADEAEGPEEEAEAEAEEEAGEMAAARGDGDAEAEDADTAEAEVEEETREGA